MYHIQNTVPIVHQNRLTQPVDTLHLVPHRDEDKDTRENEVLSLRSTKSTNIPPPSTQEEHVTWYNGMFGIMTLKQKSKYTKSSHSSVEGKLPLTSEITWFFRPAFMSYTLELRYAQSSGHVSRSFNIYPVLNDTDPIFRMCQKGDLLALQTALSGNNVSPFITNSYGQTLLHVGIVYGQLLAGDRNLTALVRHIPRPTRCLQMATFGGLECRCHGSWWTVSMHRITEASGLADGTRLISNEPEYIRNAIDQSLQRLQTDHVDLWYWFVYPASHLPFASSSHPHYTFPTFPTVQTVGPDAWTGPNWSYLHSPQSVQHLNRLTINWTGSTNSPALRVTLTLSVFLAGLEKNATNLAAMLNGVLRLAGLSDRSYSSLLGAMMTWLLKNKLNCLKDEWEKILSPIVTLTLIKYT